MLGLAPGGKASVRAVIALVPVLYLGGHLGVDVSVLVDEVDTLVHVDDDVEEQVDAFARLEHRGYHRHAEQLAELVVVELVASLLKLVEHV